MNSPRATRYSRPITSLAAALVAAFAAIGSPASAMASDNPATSSVAADPSVLREPDGSYHVFATSDDWSDGAGTRLIPHFRSFDLVEWQYVGNAFSELPSWLPPDGFVWAPDVINRDGTYQMYFSTGGERPCIGRATSPTVDGPWRDQGRPVVCMDPSRSPLDPMDPFVDVTGERPVLYMGNYEGIHAVTTTREGDSLAGTPVQVAGPGFEAPLLAHRGGQTHLFLSAGLCCTGEASDYRVVAGRAAGPLGPFFDRTGRDLNSGGGDVILRGNSRWVGPGHADIATDDSGQDWLLYHAAPRGSAVLPNGTQRRQLLLDRLDWVDGWPAVSDGTPSTSRTADPVVSVPVRLDARGQVTVESDPSETIATAPISIRTTAAPFVGEIWATLTGPSYVPTRLEFSAADGTSALTLPVNAPARANLGRDLRVRVPDSLPPGTYELVFHIGEHAATDTELATFGLRVDSPSSTPRPDSLGSVSLGSVGAGLSGTPDLGSAGTGSMGSGTAGTGSAGS